MPVEGNRQPVGLLHGGASAVLAETLGSFHAACSRRPGPAGWHRAELLAPSLGDLPVWSPACRFLHAGRTLATFEIVVSDDRTAASAPPDSPATSGRSGNAQIGGLVPGSASSSLPVPVFMTSRSPGCRPGPSATAPAARSAPPAARGALGVDLGDDPEDLLDDHRRQTHRRLVEQQQPRPGHQRPADRHHLLLAAGQRSADLGAALRHPREQRRTPDPASPCRRPWSRTSGRSDPCRGSPGRSSREIRHGPRAPVPPRAAPADAPSSW